MVKTNIQGGQDTRGGRGDVEEQHPSSMICLLPCAWTGGSLLEPYKLSLEDHTDLLLVKGTRMRSCQTAALGPGFFLVHDSAQPRVAGMWQQVLDEDNPAPLGHCVLLNHHYITPQTVQELTDEPIQVWEEIPKGLSVRSISRCCRECRKAHGGHAQDWVTLIWNTALN